MGERFQDICRILSEIDGETEEVVDFVELTNFDLQSFCVQFDVPVETDPRMLDRYSVGPDDVSFLEAVLKRPLTLDLERRAYFIEALIRDC
jgi:hypothetical protein